LNIGFQANILESRTFSMFVVHALILTFMTTPLCFFFYPANTKLRLVRSVSPIMPKKLDRRVENVETV
jgi:hypothetical protein